MKLSEWRKLYRHWLGGFKDNTISADWREYARKETEIESLRAHITKLEAVVEAAMCIDFDGVANVLEEVALDEGDESIVADVRALEELLVDFRRREVK